MKIKTTSLLFLVILLAGLLSGCTGQTLATSWPGVTTENDMVYLAYTSFVYAVNADGSTAWIYPEKADSKKIFYAAPAVSGNQVFAGDYKNVLYSLDQQTGRENWAFTEAKDRYIGKPLAIEDAGLVLAPNADHNLYALDSAGKLQWKFATGDPIWAQPLTTGKAIYAASMDGYLYALGMDGKQIWSTNLGAAVVYSLAISEDGSQLYAGTLGNEMVAVNADTGTVAWRKPTSGGVWGRAVIQDDVLYFGDQSGKITAMAASDGATRWQYAAPAPVIGSGAILGEQGIAFPVENGNVVALDWKGVAIWTQPVNGKLYSNPVIAGERLVVPVTQGTENLLLVSFNPNGTQGWTFSQPK